jgi:predicted HAD superfamily Cof-like phosphohydrolase
MDFIIVNGKPYTRDGIPLIPCPAHQVKEFSEGARGKKTPLKPSPLTEDRVKFLTKNVISELIELAQTVCPTPQAAFFLVIHALETDINWNRKRPENKDEIMEQQFDAFVDYTYYSLNVFSEFGMNPMEAFEEVHAANMRKRKMDGTFEIRKSDGKIMKPDNWVGPKVSKIVENQLNNGGFHNIIPAHENTFLMGPNKFPDPKTPERDPETKQKISPPPLPTEKPPRSHKKNSWVKGDSIRKEDNDNLKER